MQDIAASGAAFAAILGDGSVVATEAALNFGIDWDHASS